MCFRITLFSSLLIALVMSAPPADAGPPTAKPPADAALAPQVTDAVVRIDLGGRFTCSGVVVTAEGHVVAAARSVTGYQYGAIAIGPSHIPATVVAVDPKHGLIIFKAQSPLPRWATLDPAPGPPKDDPARIIAYASTSSDPPMVELKNGPAKIDTPHFSGESAGDMDLSDLLIVRSSGEPPALRAEGAPVFSSKSGRFLGVVIGKMDGYGQSNRLIVMPATAVRTLLESKKIALPSP